MLCRTFIVTQLLIQRDSQLGSDPPVEDHWSNRRVRSTVCIRVEYKHYLA